jgi:hypothetical protein
VARQSASRAGASALSIVLAATLVLAASTGVVALVAAVVLVVQALLASAPSPADERGRSIPTPRSVATMSAGIASCVVALFPRLLLGADGTVVGRKDVVSNGVFAGTLLGVAVGVFVALVAQMLRRDDRRHLVLSTSSAISLALFASLASAWIGAARSASGSDVVMIAAAGLAAALLVWTIPIDRFLCAAAAITAGATASAVAALVISALPTWVFGVAIGSGTALFAILGQVLARAWSYGRTHASAGWGFPGAMGVAMAGPVVYLGGQLITLGL